MTGTRKCATSPFLTQKNYDRALRRYLAVRNTLATVQELGLPLVQVNIAKNQVVKND